MTRTARSLRFFRATGATAAAVGCALLGGAAALRAQAAMPTLAQYLTQSIGLSTGEVAAIENLEPVVKSLDTRQDREVSIFGIIVTAASRDAVLRHVREHTAWLRTPTRTRLGVFSEPPRLADLQNVRIDPGIIDELRKCQPGSCAVKLPADAMESVRAQLASVPDPLEQLTAFTRQRMLAYVQEYRAHGDSAMVVYDDGTPVRSSSAFAQLLARSANIYQYLPSFGAYLTNFPRVPLEGVDDVYFWAEESMPKLRRTITVTHQAIYTPLDVPGISVIAEKQIYASHYFEAAVDITAIVDRPRGGSYIVVLRRYQFDALPGGLLGIRRRAVNSLVDRTTSDLARIRSIVER